MKVPNIQAKYISTGNYHIFGFIMNTLEQLGLNNFDKIETVHFLGIKAKKIVALIDLDDNVWV